MHKRMLKRSGWRVHQQKHKIRKKTKLALFVLGILLVLLFLSQMIQFVKFLTASYSINTSRRYTWNGEFNFNFVINSKPIALVSYNPKDRKVTILTIPDETYIDVPFGFGKWQARSIYELGQVSNIGGEKLLKASISSFLGLPVDGFSSENLVDILRRNFFSGIQTLPKLSTDLTLWELLKLKINLLQVRFDKVTKLELEKLIVLERHSLADGTEVFISDPIRLDSILGDFTDPKIQSEHLSVAVFNATDKPQLAQKAKRLIENLGGNVIAVQNAPIRLKKTYVEGEKSKTLDRLMQIFDLGCSNNPKCDKIPRSDLGAVSSRSQIIVVLGQDF